MLRTVIGEQGGQRPRRLHIVRSVDPGLALCRSSGPGASSWKRAGHCAEVESAQERGAAHRKRSLALEHLPGEVRVPDLMLAQQATIAAWDRSPSRDLPDRRRLRALRRRAGSHPRPRAACARTTSGTSGLCNPGLLAGDLREARARGIAGGRCRALRCPPTSGRSMTLVASSRAAQPDLDDRSVGWRSRKGEEGDRRRHLEEAGVDAIARIEDLRQAGPPALRPRSAFRRSGCAR